MDDLLALMGDGCCEDDSGSGHAPRPSDDVTDDTAGELSSSSSSSQQMHRHHPQQQQQAAAGAAARSPSQQQQRYHHHHHATLPPPARSASSSSPSQHRQHHHHGTATSTATSDKRKKHQMNVTVSSSKQQQQRITSSVDGHVEIRMTRRLISGHDLMDLIASHKYQSTPSLAAMSLSRLNTLLADPATIVDPANVCGRTQHLITVGIVFENSGTRMASSGQGFCLLKIGTLAAGPCVTVLLFGPVYSKYCRTCSPGKVVALVNPRLLPPKPAGKTTSYRNQRQQLNDTAVTFSVNDMHEFHLVADALDYGVCKARIRGKLDNGQWVTDAKRCPHYVDKRVAEYCQQHRKQALVRQPQNQSRSTAVGGGIATKMATNTTTTMMQHLRQDATMFGGRQHSNRCIGLPDKPSLRVSSSAHQLKQSQQVRPQQQQQQQQQRLVTMGRRSGPTTVAAQTTTARTNDVSHATSTNRLLNPYTGQGASASAPAKGRHLSTQPQHHRTQTAAAMMSTATATNDTTQHGRPSLSSLMSHQEIRSRITNTSTAAKNKKKKLVDLSDRLHPGRAAAQHVAMKNNKYQQRQQQKPPLKNTGKTKINTDTVGGFDGAVLVPKPSRLLFGAGASKSGNNSTIVARQQQQQRQQQQPCTSQILSRQRDYADQIRRCSTDQDSATTAGKAGAGKKRSASSSVDNNNTSQDLGTLFDINIQNTDTIVAAKSRFDHEARAEEYARSRNVVTELERRKEKKQKNDSKKQKKNSTASASKEDHHPNSIQKEWYCCQCKTTTKNNPIACVRLHHQIKIRRTIQEKKTVGEKRMLLSNAEGGIKLGQGLEWSGRNWSH